MSNYVIVDLEMCSVPRGVKREAFPCENELIQIGAVVVDESYRITDEFVTYVSPEYGVIDSFIENLTGISRADVSGAPCAEEALKRFLQWLPQDAVLVSWSDSDRKQILREMRGKGIALEPMDAYLKNWIDCQKSFGERMEANKKYKLSEALIIADVDYDSGEHDALVDAKNTARLFVKMQTEPEMKLNPYYSGHVETAAYNPFAVLLGSFDLAG